MKTPARDYRQFKRRSRLVKHLLGATIIFSGACILFTQVVIPGVYAKNTTEQEFIPVPAKYIDNLGKTRTENLAFSELLKKGLPLTPEYLEHPNYYLNNPTKDVPRSFKLEIPKLGIKNITVETNSVETSPEGKIGHYKGSSYPDEMGNAFIYGHSSLPALYSPTDIKTVFTFLPDLKVGDDIDIEWNGEKLKFRVDDMKIVNPEKVDPLAKKYLNYSSVTLMTCVPPGETTNRLMVFAKKVN